MNDANDKDRLLLARCALILFIAGLLGPFIMALIAILVLGPHSSESAAALAFGFGFIAEALALVFGIVGRRHLAGKIAMFGAATLLLLVVLLGFLWFMWSSR